MPFQVSPGVNVSEVDLTTIVPAVSTTEGAIAAHLRWGPVQKRILIDSEDALVKQFQTPNSNTAADFFVAASFLGYGNKLYVARVVRESNTGTKTTDTLIARNAHGNSANNKNTIIKSIDDYENNFPNGISAVGNWIAKYPGDIGNSIRVSICGAANTFSSTLTGKTTIANNSVRVRGIGTAFTTEITAGDLIILGPNRIVCVANNIVSANTLNLTAVYVGNTVAAVGAGLTTTRRWEFHSYFDAAPGTSAYVTTRGGTADEIHIAVVDEDGKFAGTKDTVLERFAAVSQASDAKTSDGSDNFYKNVINDNSQYIWWASHASGLGSAGSKADGKTFTGPGSMAIKSSLGLGRDGAAPRDADYINGYDLFASAEDVDVSLVIGGESNATRAIHIINNVAEKRKDCIAVLSTRRGDVVNNASYVNKEMDDSITFRNLLPSSSYAVLDSGFKYIYDKYNDLYRYVALSGDSAGLMVRTDNERDPWFSPAGFNRGQVKNVIKLAYNPSKAARDQLYKAGINPVVTFPGQGTVLFGDKTLLAKPSAFDRINVRRLFIVLEKAISTAAKFSLFEFNDEFTRAQFRNLVEPFLRDVQGRRGIFDFRVVCDGSNNTPEVIDRNEFIGDIYVKPARSINFIQLNFVAVRTGVEFSEVVGQF